MAPTYRPRHAPSPPAGFSAWLDFAVESFNARGAEVLSLLDDRIAEPYIMTAREAARSELDDLRESARLLRFAARWRIAEKVRLLLKESGSRHPPEGFDAVRWAEDWMNIPLHELKGRTPAQATFMDEGWPMVESLLDRMGGGLVG